jgi:hypothetical protein
MEENNLLNVSLTLEERKGYTLDDLKLYKPGYFVVTKHGNIEGDFSGNPPTVYFYRHNDETRLFSELLEENIATFHYVYSEHHNDEVCYQFYHADKWPFYRISQGEMQIKICDFKDNTFSIGSTHMGLSVCNLTPSLKERIRGLILQYFGSYGKKDGCDGAIFSGGSWYHELEDAV